MRERMSVFNFTYISEAVSWHTISDIEHDVEVWANNLIILYNIKKMQRPY